MGLHISLLLFIHVLCGGAHGQLAQCGKITLAEKLRRRVSYLLGDIDFAFLESFQQLVRGQVNNLNLSRIVNDTVRYCFAYPDAGNLRYHIPQTLYMLDIECGIDINPSLKQFLYILITLEVAGVRGIRVGEFIYQCQLWPTRKHGIQVHLG